MKYTFYAEIITSKITMTSTMIESKHLIVRTIPKWLLGYSFVVAFIACESVPSQPPPPPPFPPKLDCITTSLYCEPDDSCDYQHIVCTFYLINGHIYERKEMEGFFCCKYTIAYDSTLGYYRDSKPLDDFIDVNSFVCNIDSTDYSKDKNHVYWFRYNSDGGIRFILDEADPKTFKGLSDYRWGIDNKHVFYRENMLEGLNLEKMQCLIRDGSDKRLDYIKDDKIVFYQNDKIEKADAKTFQLTEITQKNDFDAFDKYRKYRYGIPQN